MDVLITFIECRFTIALYRKPEFAEQYLNTEFSTIINMYAGEPAYILSTDNLINKPTLQMNAICQPLIKNERTLNKYSTT